MTTRHLAVVTPRYGAQVIGGAELAARLVAEHLVADRGWTVDVFTTTATDASTWADALPEGTTVESGVTVHRFRPESGRREDFDRRTAPLVHHADEATIVEAREWLASQGPRCPALVDAVAGSPAHVVALTPYLFEPIVATAERIGRRAVLHPAAHDEWILRLPIYRSVFAGVGGFAFYTFGEQALVAREFPETAALPQAVVGLGVDPAAGDGGRATSSGSADGGRATSSGSADHGAPYLVCLGRVDRGKGTDLLAAVFAGYKTRRPGPLRLKFVGPVVHRPPSHPDIEVLGAVPMQERDRLLSGAVALVSPSVMESFSFVVLEAWLAGTPVLVHGWCEATTEHVEMSGGGLAFTDYRTFEAVLDRLLGDRPLRAAMAAAGAAYVHRRFSWPTVLDRYEALLARVAAGAGH